MSVRRTKRTNIDRRHELPTTGRDVQLEQFVHFRPRRRRPFRFVLPEHMRFVARIERTTTFQHDRNELPIVQIAHVPRDQMSYRSCRSNAQDFSRDRPSRFRTSGQDASQRPNTDRGGEHQQLAHVPETNDRNRGGEHAKTTTRERFSRWCNTRDTEIPRDQTNSHPTLVDQRGKHENSVGPMLFAVIVQLQRDDEHVTFRMHG